jgi:hypothetical protein
MANSTERTKKWYANNKEKALDYLRKRRKDRRAWFDEIVNKLSCVKCGENHPGCLDFHHRDPGTKDGAIGHMLNDFTSKELILAEMKKCDVLCANCHRKHHHEERIRDSFNGRTLA